MRSQAYATSEMQPRLSNDQVVNPLDADSTVCRSQQPEQLNPSQQQAEQSQQQLQSSGQQLGQQVQQLRLQQANALSSQQQPLIHDVREQQKQPVFLETSVGSLDHCGAQGLDAREIVWQKLQVLKDRYLQDMKELYSMLWTRSTMPMPPEQLEKLKHYKDVLHNMIPYLTVPKEKVPQDFNTDKVENLEGQIVKIMEIFKRRRPALSQQPTVQSGFQFTSQQLGQQIQQLRLQQANALSSQQQPIIHDVREQQKQPVFLESSVDSNHCGAQGLDAREAVWLKLQVLKDKYLQDMKELYSMLWTRSTMPMPPEQLQKLKHYKDVLHSMIPYLTVPKEKVPQDFNPDKVENFEGQIVKIMETFKRRRPPLSQQPTVQPQL